MKLALDAMGGDHAPAAMVHGAVDFARENPTVSVFVVGQPVPIHRHLAEAGAVPAKLHGLEATEVIGMGD